VLIQARLERTETNLIHFKWEVTYWTHKPTWDSVWIAALLYFCFSYKQKKNLDLSARNVTFTVDFGRVSWIGIVADSPCAAIISLKCELCKGETREDPITPNQPVLSSVSLVVCETVLLRTRSESSGFRLIKPPFRSINLWLEWSTCVRNPWVEGCGLLLDARPWPIIWLEVCYRRIAWVWELNLNFPKLTSPNNIK